MNHKTLATGGRSLVVTGAREPVPSVGRRRALRMLLVGGLGMVGSGCATVTGPAASASPSAHPDGTTGSESRQAVLRLALLPITDCVPFYVAAQQGYFEEESVRVELISAGSAAERDQLLITGQADGGVTDLVAVALFNAQQAGLRVVRNAREATAESPQFWVLAAEGSSIVSPADLRGVEIAVSENSVIQYVTERLLERQGLDSSQVKTVNVPQIPVRFQLLDQGQVQAATLPDPFASLALLQGARTVVSDGSCPEISISVLAFRSRTIEEHPELVRGVLAAYGRAIDAIAGAPEAFEDVLIEKGRVPELLRGQYTYPPFPKAVVASEAQWQDVIDWCLGKGLLDAAIPYAQAVDASLLP